MGLALDDFWRLTPSEFTAARNQHYRSINAQSKEAWQRAAWIAFRTVCPPEGKSLSFKKFTPEGITGKKEKQKPVMTRKDQEKEFRKMAERFK